MLGLVLLTRRAFGAGTLGCAASAALADQGATAMAICALRSIGECAVAGGVYATRFDSDERPLSEGGRWAHLDSTLTVCRSLGGVAFGTQRGGAFDDSNAYMAGFGNDHEVEATVWLRPDAPVSPNREVEILLRWRDDNRLRQTKYGMTRATGYEINWSHSGAYLALGRFKGAELVRAAVKHRPRTGDRFRGRIEGQRIRVWINGLQVIDHVDAHPLLRITQGHPGIGFYIDGGASNFDFGFDAVTISTL